MQRRKALKIVGAALSIPVTAIAGLLATREKRKSSLVVYYSPAARSSIVVGAAGEVIAYAKLCGLDLAEGVVLMMAEHHGAAAIFLTDSHCVKNHELIAEAMWQTEVHVSREIVAGLADSLRAYKSCDWVWEKRRLQMA